MIDYIKGTLIEVNPASIVLECNGIGYNILISLQTFEILQNQEKAVVYIHHYLTEDNELYYGFATKDERELFRLLISVSGIGVNTARMMLSSLTSDEIRSAILSENVSRLKSVKGLGVKSAQRIILELKDKIVKGEGMENAPLLRAEKNAAAEEATTALVMLGFSKANINKAIPVILKKNPNATVEEIIRTALQML